MNSMEFTNVTTTRRTVAGAYALLHNIYQIKKKARSNVTRLLKMSQKKVLKSQNIPCRVSGAKKTAWVVLELMKLEKLLVGRTASACEDFIVPEAICAYRAQRQKLTEESLHLISLSVPKE